MSVSFQLVHSRGLSSTLIGIGSPGFSHVDIIRPDGRLQGARSDKIGGALRGVQIRTPFYEKWDRRVVMTLPATSYQEQRFWEFADAQLGKPYDWRAIVAFAIERDWRDPDSWFCSEYGAACLEESGILPKLYVAENKITPEALALAISVLEPSITES